MATSTKIPWIASVVAFLIAGSVLYAALTGQIILLLFAVIPLIAGIGIARKRVWSAYGFALFLSAQLLLPITLGLLRPGNIGVSREILPSAGLMVVLIALFFFAGRSLAAAGSRRGWASPWIAVSVLFTAPLLFF